MVNPSSRVNQSVVSQDDAAGIPTIDGNEDDVLIQDTSTGEMKVYRLVRPRSTPNSRTFIPRDVFGKNSKFFKNGHAQIQKTWIKLQMQ